MADKLLEVKVSIPMASALPEDAIVNTWHFDGDDGNTDAEYWSSALTMLQTFYQAIDGDFGAQCGTTANLKFYDMRDPEPRIPEHINAFTLTPSVSTSYPGEVCVCLSYAADIASGDNPARKRGRIFLGPIKETARTIISNTVYVSGSTTTAIANAAAALENGLPLTTGSNKWALFSPTTLAETGNLDTAFSDVVDGWVDNAFDIQRRRGTKPSIRTTWT